MSIKVAVIGAGAMGTAVSQTIAPNANVLLYARRKEVCDSINNNRINKQYFPNVNLHENILGKPVKKDLKKGTPFELEFID